MKKKIHRTRRATRPLARPHRIKGVHR